MEITRRFVNGVTVLDMVGRFTVCSTDTLRAVIGELVAEGRLDVLVHLGGLTDLDAHGLGELVWSCTTLRHFNGQMAVIAPSRYVRRLLAVTRLDTVLTVHDSEAEATRDRRFFKRDGQLSTRVGGASVSLSGIVMRKCWPSSAGAY